MSVEPKEVESERLHRRVGSGMKQSDNWLQLVKFGAVGASGYFINLVVFKVSLHEFDIDYRLAAVIAFFFAVTNNFIWNRYWTFSASDGNAGFQAPRFFVVSLVALAFNLVLLQILVGAGVGKLTAQAIAVICATPLNFIGNKLWSFDSRR